MTDNTWHPSDDPQHHWTDITAFADDARHYICECGARRIEPFSTEIIDNRPQDARTPSTSRGLWDRRTL